MTSVRQGYKHTEIGIVPKDWNIEKLGNSANIVRGGSPRPIESYLTTSADGINWIKIGDVAVGQKYIRHTAEKIIASGVNHSREVKVGDLLLSNSMSYGRPYILSIDGCIHDGWLAISSYEQHFDKEFLCYILASKYVERQYGELAAGTGVKNLNKTIVKQVKLAYPSDKKEQRAIANALSDIDALIEAKEALLEKKRAIKLGAMQELLTGKKRLPGFPVTPMKHTEVGEIPEDWTIKELGKILSIRHGKPQKEVETNKGEYPIMATGGQIGWACSFLYDKPSVLIGRKGTIDKPRFINTPFWTVDTLFYSVIQENYDPFFVYSACCRINWEAYNEGTCVPSLTSSTIEKICLYLPQGKDEQQAIASVLSDMDSEIESLEQEIAKLRDLKQGMMQQLLTGKIRLIKTKKDNKKANSTFKAAVLVSEIFSRYESDKHLGSIKMAKLYYMAATMADVWEELNFHPLQQAAGPYDPKWRRSMTKLLERQKCIREVKVSYGNGKIATHYERMDNYDNFRSKYTWDRYFTKEQRDVMVHVFDIFLNASTDQAEIAATVMGAWVKCIEDGDVSDDKVIERAQNWSERKKRFKPEQWTSALAWMKKKNLIPPYTQEK